MSDDKPQSLTGPDFKAGVHFGGLAENEPLLGHFEGEPAILVRQGQQVFATGAVCTHYGGPLAEGLVVGETIRCPWHHARFSLRTGEAEGAPALNPVSCFNVRRQDEMVTIDGKKAADFRVACPLNPFFRGNRRGRRRRRGVRGYAARKRIRRADHAGRRRGTRSGGPSESLQGFSCRYRERGLDSTPHAGILRIDSSRAGYRRPGRSHQPRRPSGRAAQRTNTQLWRAVAGDRRGASLALDRRRGPAACFPAQDPGRQHSDHRQGPESEKLRGDRFQLYRSGSGGVAAAPRAASLGDRPGRRSARKGSWSGAWRIRSETARTARGPFLPER